MAKSILFIILLSCAVGHAQNYQFYGTMSRQQLESYLSRSLACEFDSLNRGKQEYYDLIDFTSRNNARYLSRICNFGYGSALPINHGIFDSISNIVQDINNAYTRLGYVPPINEGTILESVPHDVDSILMNDEVANTYHVIKRNFMYDSIKYVKDTSTIRAIPDISRIETQMYFYFLATQMIDCGIESIHMGVVAWENRNDTDHTAEWDLASKIRKYAQKHNRGLVLLNGDNTMIYLRKTDTLVFDFNTAPTRVTGYYTGKDSTWYSMWDYFESPVGGPGIITYNECSSYGKMTGGQTPLGWYADTMLFSVGLDNTTTNNCNCLSRGGCWNVYGYDEISWFVLQNKDYRNEWLCYAATQIKKLDKNAFLKLPIRTLFTKKWKYYDALNGYGYDQENEILDIWSGNAGNCNPNEVTNIQSIYGPNISADGISVVVYPNPVSGVANIIYYAPNAGAVAITIEDLTGRKVATLMPTTTFSGGIVEWDTNGMVPGCYICTATKQNGIKAKCKITVIK